MTMDTVSATIVASGWAQIWLQYKYFNFYITILNLTKPFKGGLWQYMRKAACPSGGVDSLNPSRWRGKGLHHHGDGVCKVICAFCAAFLTLRGWFYLTERLIGITFWST
jgi:hypothetical protein